MYKELGCSTHTCHVACAACTACCIIPSKLLCLCSCIDRWDTYVHRFNSSSLKAFGNFRHISEYLCIHQKGQCYIFVIRGVHALLPKFMTISMGSIGGGAECILWRKLFSLKIFYANAKLEMKSGIYLGTLRHSKQLVLFAWYWRWQTKGRQYSWWNLGTQLYKKAYNEFDDCECLFRNSRYNAEGIFVMRLKLLAM